MERAGKHIQSLNISSILLSFEEYHIYSEVAECIPIRLCLNCLDFPWSQEGLQYGRAALAVPNLLKTSVPII